MFTRYVSQRYGKKCFVDISFHDHTSSIEHAKLTQEYDTLVLLSRCWVTHDLPSFCAVASKSSSSLVLSERASISFSSLASSYLSLLDIFRAVVLPSEAATVDFAFFWSWSSAHLSVDSDILPAPVPCRKRVQAWTSRVKTESLLSLTYARMALATIACLLRRPSQCCDGAKVPTVSSQKAIECTVTPSKGMDWIPAHLDNILKICPTICDA